MRERYIIFKQACGNCSLSFMVSILILAIKILVIGTDFAPTLGVIIIMFLLLFPLTNGFDAHDKRKRIWDELILNEN